MIIGYFCLAAKSNILRGRKWLIVTFAKQHWNEFKLYDETRIGMSFGSPQWKGDYSEEGLIRKGFPEEIFKLNFEWRRSITHIHSAPGTIHLCSTYLFGICCSIALFRVLWGIHRNTKLHLCLPPETSNLLRRFTFPPLLMLPFIWSDNPLT